MKQENRIILLGYMASGKSTIGKKLALSLNLPFIDLDAYIVNHNKKSISAIFSDKGEIYFRELELKFLKKILKKEKKFVLALGGGTPQIEGVMNLFDKNCTSIYLEASVETLYKRLIPKEIERPILDPIDESLLKEYIQMHFLEREKHYKQAFHTQQIDNLSIEAIVNEIELKLKSKNYK
jgi:shikimate kinase